MKAINLISTIFLCLLGGATLSQSGVLDPSFGSGGIVTQNAGPGIRHGEGITIRSDGKIIMVGTYITPSFVKGIIQRRLIDGSLDNSFGNSGSILTDGPHYMFRDVVVQDDGKILITGAIESTSPNYDYEVFIYRMNADTGADWSFGNQGLVVNIFANYGAGGIYESIALQPDGKIVVSGTATSPTSSDLIIARYNTDGTLDSSFGTNGIVTVDINDDDQVGEFVAIQYGGKIVAGGTDYSSGSGDYLVVRVNPDGTMDNSFGTNGIVTTDVSLGNNETRAGASHSDGKIVVHGTAEIEVGQTSTQEFCTIRYNVDGTIDSGFGSNGGIILTPMGNSGEAVGTTMAIQWNDAIIIAGNALESGVSQFAMARYLSDGTLDPMFGNSGKVLTPMGSGESFCNAMAIQSAGVDQPIVLAGEFFDVPGNSVLALARYANYVGLSDLNPNEYSFSVFPNPITEESVIDYSLVRNEKISIRLYDLNGRLVQTFLENENQEEGDHQIALNIDLGLLNGNYLLHVESETWSYNYSIEIFR